MMGRGKGGRCGDGGSEQLQQQRKGGDGGSVATTTAETGPTVAEVAGSEQGEAVAVMAEAAIGFLPRSSLNNHLRGSSLLSFFK